MPGTYTYINYSTARAQLLERLDDTSAYFWKNTGAYNEVGMYLQEAMRTWQLYTGYWRVRATFNTAAATPFYDLTSTASTGAGAQNPAAYLAYSLKDQDLFALMQYHLIETSGAVANGGTSWIGTGMFTSADFTEALQRRRNQFLYDTGCVVTHSTQVVSPVPNAGRIALADTIIDVRRAAWITPGSTVTPLWPQDEYNATAVVPGWSANAGSALAYSIIGTPPLYLQLIPPPNDVGTLDLLTVNTGANLDPTTGVVLGIPDNLAHGIKWGAMADLLSIDGPASDPARAAYCQARYEECVEMARVMPVIAQAQLQGVTTLPHSVADADALNPSWQTTGTTPTTLGTAGLNLLSAVPLADAGPYSVTLDVVRNAPVPTQDADFLQLGREVLDVIYGYAQHLAAFKHGGAEFSATFPLVQQFVRAAGVYNDRLRATSMYLSTLQGQSWQEVFLRPRRQSDQTTVPR